eukprot:GHVS01048081.1.p1 GENE.GHVS01048081.1~~GHVS01048081.1.p1  ORF type:complete len:202 (+),score=11.29 GHVS01048081.1:517-1122(+)
MAKAGAHAGLSGVLCGYFGFLIVSVFLEHPRRIKTLAVMGLTAMIYGTMFMATLTSIGQNVSWESHLFGLCSGVASSALYFLKYEGCMTDPIAPIQRRRRTRRDSSVPVQDISLHARPVTITKLSFSSKATDWVIDEAVAYGMGSEYPDITGRDDRVVMGKPITAGSRAATQSSLSSEEVEMDGDFDGSLVAESCGLYAHK